jgi:hypothetical protein
MRRSSCWPGRGWPLGLAVLAAVLSWAGFGSPRAAAAVPTLTVIRAQLKQVFNAWDLNSDGFLDKAELAKAFRGPGAKPFDYRAKGKNPEKIPRKQPDYSSYPDYQFLVQLDTDKDQRISKKEWTAWAFCSLSWARSWALISRE